MGRKKKHNKHLPPKVELDRGTYYYRHKGKRTNLGKDLIKAMAQYGSLVNTEHNLKYMREIINRYITEIATHLAPNTYKNELFYIKNLIKNFGEALPSQITPVHVYRYLDWRGQASKSQANKEIALLSKIMKYAIRWGLIENNPCRDIQKYKLPPRTRYINHEEFLSVANQDKFMGQVMLLAYLTALRQSDILGILTINIKPEGLRVFINKTQEWAEISYTDALKDCIDQILKLRHKHTRKSHLVCNQRGEAYTREGFKTNWQRLINGCLDKGIISERFTFHDIRAKSATDAKEKNGINFSQALLNHSSASITERVYIRGAKKIRPLG